VPELPWQESPHPDGPCLVYTVRVGTRALADDGGASMSSKSSLQGCTYQAHHCRLIFGLCLKELCERVNERQRIHRQVLTVRGGQVNRKQKISRV